MSTEYQDVVRRNIKRELPCRLTEEEFTRIARQRVAKEAELAQLEADLTREKKKRQDQISELEDEIKKMGRELHTEHQDRTVPCNDVFVRADDGTGWIHTIRQDTHEEVERRPATGHETQRYLPSVEGSGPPSSVLDDARAQQRSAQDAVDDIPPEADEDGDDNAKPTAKYKRGSKSGKGK